MVLLVKSFAEFMGTINRFILRIEKVVLSILLTGMVVFGFLQVFSRFILQSPIGWSEELLTYSFTWVSFIGASMAIYTKSHFSVDLLVRKLPLSFLKPLHIFTWVLLCGFSIFILVLGWKLTLLNSIQRMNVLPISMTWAYLALPVFGLFTFLHSLEKLLEVILNIEKAEDSEL
jgi:TRAP-type C4-dicarboxylate transport system permease small subunit